MAVASLSKPGRRASLNMWCVFKEKYQELTQKSFHMYVKYIYGLTGQAKTIFVLRTLSSYLVNLWSSRRSVSRAGKRWQEFPPQDLLQKGLVSQVTRGAEGNEASHLLIISPCSPPRGPVTSGTCHNSQWASTTNIHFLLH